MFQYFNEFSIIAVAHLIAVISPGPDFALVIRQSIQYNRKTAIISSIGIASGILIHISYCLLGVAFLLSNYVILYDLLKFICAFYLFYLGLQSLIQKNSNNNNSREKSLSKKIKINYFDAYKEGLITNVLNVKATLFFLSLYSFISIETPRLIQMFYGFWMCFITGLWFILVSIFFTTKIVNNYTSKYNIVLKKIMGIVLIYIAIKIFLYY